MKFISYLLLSILMVVFPNNLRAETLEVIWAGVGFSGDWGSRERFYPYTSLLFVEEGAPLEKMARERILDASHYKFEISNTGQINENSLDQIALAITFSRESVMHEKIVVSNSIQYLENYSLSGAAIFFNLKTNKLIASVPLITRYSKLYSSPPSEQINQQIFNSMLQSDDLGMNFFSEISKKLEMVELSSLPSKYIQIQGFEIDPTVHSSVSESPDADLFVSYLSTFFENRLLSESGISLIPNNIGHAIGNKISTRLPSGDRTITLPEPGYTIDFRIHKLLYQKKESKLTDSLCWGGVLSMTANSHLFGDEELAKIGFKDVNCATVDKEMTLDNYTEYQKLMMGLLDGLAQQFGEVDKKWLKEKALDKKQDQKSIEKLSEEFKDVMF